MTADLRYSIYMKMTALYLHRRMYRVLSIGIPAMIFFIFLTCLAYAGVYIKQEGSYKGEGGSDAQPILLGPQPGKVYDNTMFKDLPRRMHDAKPVHYSVMDRRGGLDYRDLSKLYPQNE